MHRRLFRSIEQGRCDHDWVYAMLWGTRAEFATSNLKSLVQFVRKHIIEPDVNNLAQSAKVSACLDIICQTISASDIVPNIGQSAIGLVENPVSSPESIANRRRKRQKRSGDVYYLRPALEGDSDPSSPPLVGASTHRKFMSSFLASPAATLGYHMTHPSSSSDPSHLAFDGSDTGRILDAFRRVRHAMTSGDARRSADMLRNQSRDALSIPPVPPTMTPAPPPSSKTDVCADAYVSDIVSDQSLQDTETIHIWRDIFDAIYAFLGDNDSNRTLSALKEGGQWGEATIVKYCQDAFMFACIARIPSIRKWLLSGQETMPDRRGPISTPPSPSSSSSHKIINRRTLEHFIEDILEPGIQKVVNGRMTVDAFVATCEQNYMMIVGTWNPHHTRNDYRDPDRPEHVLTSRADRFEESSSSSPPPASPMIIAAANTPV